MSHHLAAGARLASLAKRLISGIGVGGVATLVDLAMLTFLVEALSFTPSHANVPALLAGASIQFLGCRHVVFHASDASVSRQFTAFAGVELVTLTLNGVLFQALVSADLPYVFARLLATFGVFVLFSFPAWHWVFRRHRAVAS